MQYFRILVFLGFLKASVATQLLNNTNIIPLLNVSFGDYKKFNESKVTAILKELEKVDFKSQKAVINEWVDELLINLNSFLLEHELDKTEIPGLDASFRWTVFSGWVVLDEGYADGVSTFKRANDVVITYEYPYLKAKIPLSFSKLEYIYRYEMKFMHLGPVGTAYGDSKNNRFTLDVSLNMITFRASLDKFVLHTLGKMTLKFSGNILTDWIVNLAVAAIMPILKPILGLVVESYVVNGLLHGFTKYNNVVCTLLGDC